MSELLDKTGEVFDQVGSEIAFHLRRGDTRGFADNETQSLALYQNDGRMTAYIP